MYFILLKIAGVFNFILLVILILCFRAVIPQFVVDTFFFIIIIIIITHEVSLWAKLGNRMSYTFLFNYVLRRRRVRDKEYPNIRNIVRTLE